MRQANIVEQKLGDVHRGSAFAKISGLCNLMQVPNTKIFWEDSISFFYAHFVVWIHLDLLFVCSNCIVS